VPTVVLYGYKTWLLALRKEYRLSMFDRRVLRKIFGNSRRLEKPA
jgi:hypothetical protein